MFPIETLSCITGSYICFPGIYLLCPCETAKCVKEGWHTRSHVCVSQVLGNVSLGYGNVSQWHSIVCQGDTQKRVEEKLCQGQTCQGKCVKESVSRKMCQGKCVKEKCVRENVSRKTCQGKCVKEKTCQRKMCQEKPCQRKRVKENVSRKTGQGKYTWLYT